ncbi:MAG: Bifunctional purine biosynthesis protein PurH [Candidatus Peregrinibacteria bacterium GW2011_GWA2_47_7]|nr:MAG: Bifunctional purine biosynthesis protein PurH [Candidatus Peregrinibacteria bacterium GW2011_GWA2_47_7]
MIQRALISVSDKTGIVEFAQGLHELGVKIISTGGTAEVLKKSGVPVQDVSAYTGFPEMMDGRVKTLHPKIYASILARRDHAEDKKMLEQHKIKPIDLVVVNLYPFDQHKDIEHIDIGGPTLIRAAAKNFQYVTAITHPDDYETVLAEMKKNNGNTELKTRERLAKKVFSETNHYDELIANWFRENLDEAEVMDLHYEKVASLRYGENPHQKAAFFRNPFNRDANITNAKVLQGKQLSFNNIVDSNSAIELVKEFDRPTAVFIKHNNPCGVASADTIEEAFELSFNVDAKSAFGGVLALNRPCTSAITDFMFQHNLFLEIIIAPEFESDVREKLNSKKNLRLLETGPLVLDTHRRDIKKVAGGVLIQSANTYAVTEKDLQYVTKKKPTKEEIRALLFANKVVKHVTSNAVIFAKSHNGVDVVTGVGAGQMSRVDAVFIGAHKGGEHIKGSVMASDAFFPFSDGVEEAAKAGVTAIISPGGSVRDAEVIAKADELGVSMVFSGVRMFRH